MKALSDFLRPEFLSRVDEVVYFRPLVAEDYTRIAALLLDELCDPLAERGITFRYDEAVPAALAARAADGKRGARDLRVAIRREVEDKLATLLVERCEQPPTSVTVGVNDGVITLTAV